jgi:hypothetical protein
MFFVEIVNAADNPGIHLVDLKCSPIWVIYTPANFAEIVSPVFQNLRASKLTSPGTSPTALRDYLTDRLRSDMRCP